MDYRKKIIIIGFGQRGQIYAGYSKIHPEQFEVAAVVENDPEKREIAVREYGCAVYADAEAFFAARPHAHAAVIAVQDSDHLEYTVRCMEAGYDIMLEKPIACSLEDCFEIYEAYKKYKSKVIVCHVLRYTPFYRSIKKLLDDEILGDIITINASENVGFYHQAHSFVRGPWKNSAESTPMIVAKCCHDLDVIRWFMDKKCQRVSSFGDLTHFNERNAPEGSAEFCSGCKRTDCVYKAQDIYLKYPWMAKYFCNGKDAESILQALKHTQYDRCAYKSGNDVVDHQVTIMQFEGGATASLTMTAFSKKIYRDIKIHGTKGELFGIAEDNCFEVRLFGGGVQRFEVEGVEAYGNHAGGDYGIMNDFYRILCGRGIDGITDLDASIDSYKMAFNAEKARIERKVIEL